MQLAVENWSNAGALKSKIEPSDACEEGVHR
jgi:hypothetical protein